MTRKITITLATLVAFVALLASCKSNTTEQANGKPLVSVTIEPQRYFVEAIAGDLVEVNTIVPQGNSPETYDPTPMQMKKIAESKAYLRIGYIGFELTWADKIVKSAKHLKVYDTSKGIALITAGDEYHVDCTCSAHHSSDVEPHVWTSTANAKHIAKNTYDALVEIDSINATTYSENYQKLLQEISATDSIINNMFAENKVQQTFVIYHPTLSYFAKDYKLKQIAIEESGKEPSPAHLKKLIEECTATEVKTIFVQPEFDKKNAESISKQTKTKIVEINPLSYNWHQEMISIAKTLTEQ